MTLRLSIQLLVFVVLAYTATSTLAWVSPPISRGSINQRIVVVQKFAVQQEPPPSADTIRREIEEMKKEARERFEKLSVQMEQLKTDCELKKKSETKKIEQTVVSSEATTTTTATVQPKIRVDDTNKIDKFDGDFEGEILRQHQELEDIIEETLKTKTTTQFDSSVTSSPTTAESEADSQWTSAVRKAITPPVPMDLLDDTRWRVVFNIGRETGTWMPATWGVSGDRLLFQVDIDFTSEPLHSNDDFLQSTTGTKRLDIVEAFLIPRGVGTHSVGRRPLPCKATGGYKVCRGQGPLGTDLVRLYIDLTEDVYIPDHESDVFCPKGRVYATCGYFVMHDSRELAALKIKSDKDVAQIEHRDAVQRLENLQLRLESDTRTFSVDRFKLMKDIYFAKKHVDEAAKNLLLARQREPDKAQLRLSKRRDVGLSKEGGVCCKVQKGVTIEYHILGRMEVGCVDDHKDH